MNFNHSYKLTISGNAQAGPEQAFILENDLHIEFSVTKKSKGSLNSGRIDIYNLSKATRDRFQSFEQNNGVVQLEVGYQNTTLKPILIANIAGEIKTTRSGPNLITTLSLGDGYQIARDSVTSRSFPEKTTLRSIITTIATSDMGLGLGEISGKVLDEKVYQNGVTVESNSFKYLKQLAEEHKLDLSILDGVLNIIPVQGASNRSVLNVSAQTGIIGLPEKTGQKPGQTDKTPNPTNGVKISHLLLPEAAVGRFISVDSASVSGLYRITEVTHKGSFRGVDWKSEILASNIDTSKEESL